MQFGLKILPPCPGMWLVWAKEVHQMFPEGMWSSRLCEMTEEILKETFWWESWVSMGYVKEVPSSVALSWEQVIHTTLGGWMKVAVLYTEEETITSSDSVDDNMRGKLTKLREELQKAEREMEERRAGRDKKAKSRKAKKREKKERTPRKGRKAKVTLPHVGDEDDPKESKEKKKKKKSKRKAERDKKRREKSGSEEAEDRSKAKQP